MVQALNRAQRRAQKKAKPLQRSVTALPLEASLVQVRSLMEMREWAKALVQLQPLLADYPQQSEVRRRTALCYSRLGHHQEAVTHYNTLLTQRPDDVESLRELAAIMMRTGNAQQSMELYEAALVHAPDDIITLNALITIYLKNKMASKALDSCYLAVRHYPEEASFWRYFVEALMLNPDFMPSDELLGFLTAQGKLASKMAYSYATAASFCLMKAVPGLRQWAEDPATASWDALSHPLLHTLLMRSIVSQRFFELAVCHMRRYSGRLLLEKGSDALEMIPTGLLESLPHYFFLIEYIPAETAEDIEVRDGLSAILADTSQPYSPVVRAAMLLSGTFFSLREIEPVMSHWRHQVSQDDTAMQLLLRRMVDEPEEEQRIGNDIPGFGRFADDVSQAVRAQYEANPYPRWSNLGEIPEQSVAEMKQRFFAAMPAKAATCTVPEENQQILVAGCGTGMQAMNVAYSHPTAQVVNIDLSRASMGYAIRKMTEVGALEDRIQFFHGDLQEVEVLEKTFDIVESVGVLHHMADPMTGWSALTRVLRPGGLMRIGLYSRAARKEIIEFREAWQAEGHGLDNMTHQQLQQARQQLMIEGKSKPFERTIDFFSASECRDLLFHVQEHQFTIPQIKAALDELGLEFLCFIAQDMRIFNMFREVHGESASLYDLGAWEAVEEAFPRCFIAMYQFYAFKPA